MTTTGQEEKSVPQQIYILGGPNTHVQQGYDPALEPRRGDRNPRMPDLQPVNITELHTQVNVFLEQMNSVLPSTPKEVGGFHLSEIEVSAGIAFQASGGVQIILLANAAVGGEIKADLKFVFKRS